MESQPQNHEFRINPESFQPCNMKGISKVKTDFILKEARLFFRPSKHQMCDSWKLCWPFLFSSKDIPPIHTIFDRKMITDIVKLKVERYTMN